VFWHVKHRRRKNKGWRQGGSAQGAAVGANRTTRLAWAGVYEVSLGARRRGVVGARRRGDLLAVSY
jgi:hypothetical protein